MEFRGYQPHSDTNTIINDEASTLRGSSVASSSSYSSSASNDDTSPQLHDDIRNAMYPLYFIHHVAGTAGVTAAGSVGTSSSSRGNGADSNKGNKRSSSSAAADKPITANNGGTPTTTASTLSSSSSYCRIPLELEFIGTCFAVGPKIVLTTAHHYDPKSDDVGRFGVLVPCTDEMVLQLRMQQPNYQDPSEKLASKLAKLAAKLAANDAANNNGWSDSEDELLTMPRGRNNGGAGGKKNAKKKKKGSATINEPASSPASPTTPNVPTVIHANERLYLLIPCRYGAKAPANINWFKQPALTPTSRAATAATINDGKTIVTEPIQLTTSTEAETKKDGSTDVTPPLPTAITVSSVASATTTTATAKISPDLATFWLESPLPHYVRSPQHLSACSPIEGAVVTTAYYEPPKVRFAAHAVGTHVLRRHASAVSVGSSASVEDTATAGQKVDFKLFGSPIASFSVSSGPDGDTTDVPATLPTPSDCIFVAHAKSRATAVMRSLVLTMRMQSLPPIKLSKGEVLCGIACEGFHRDAKEAVGTVATTSASGADPAKDDVSTDGAGDKAATEGAQPARRRSKADGEKPVVEVIDLDGPDATREVNSGRGKVNSGKRKVPTSAAEDEKKKPPPAAMGAATAGTVDCDDANQPQTMPTRVVFQPMRAAPSSHRFMVVMDSDEDDDTAYVLSRKGIRQPVTIPMRAAPTTTTTKVIDTVIPADFRPPSDPQQLLIGVKREREEAEAAAALNSKTEEEGLKAPELRAGVDNEAPTNDAKGFPTLTMGMSPFVWWHSCLTKGTETPYGSSGGIVVDSSGAFIVGMHVATNNLFTYYKYYRPKQERILRSFYFKQKQWELSEKLKALEANALTAATTATVKLEEGDVAGGGPTVVTSDDERAAVLAELADLRERLRTAPPINAVPPKGAVDGRISEFVTGRSLVQALLALQVYLNPQ